jgi:hypothetical protein
MDGARELCRTLRSSSLGSRVYDPVRGYLGGDVRVEVRVMAQRRVHLLPFVVHVPRTAEVLSEVVLLAGDHLTQDPTRREQPRV